MKVLFDQGVPAPLRTVLAGHEVRTAFEMGWSELSNGDLLARTESTFEILVTTDQNLRAQQNLAGRRLAVLVLLTTSWPRIQKHVAKVVAAVNSLRPGDFRELSLS